MAAVDVGDVLDILIEHVDQRLDALTGDQRGKQMPSISQLVSARETTTIDVKGMTLSVTYLPNKMTFGRMTELQQRANAEDAEAVAEIVPEILEAWDAEGPLVDDAGEELVGEGEAIPITPECLDALPAFFVIALSHALQELVTNGPNPIKAAKTSRHSRKR